MFNQFCELTNKAMRNRDENTLLKHLNYMSRKLRTANKTEYEYIDVSYVESLMWNVNNEESKWAWQFFPENIKDLYTAMWGSPKF
jgi:ribonucleotide reductase beta subunit family protein with ferritin-like domain